MKNYGVMGLAAGAALVMCVVGCGSDDHNNVPPGKGGTGGSSGMAGANAAGSSGNTQGGSSQGGAAGNAGTSGSTMGDAGDANAGAGGAGDKPEPIVFQSQPAGITLELDAKSQASGLTLRSSSITQKTDSSLFYTEWLAELFNGSNTTQCLIAVSGDFQTAGGVSVEKFDTYAEGAAYKLGSSKLTSPCVAPGESVPLWSNDLPGMVLGIDTIKKLVVSITPLPSPDAVLHPSTPTLAPITKNYSATFKAWQIS